MTVSFRRDLSTNSLPITCHISPIIGRSYCIKMATSLTPPLIQWLYAKSFMLLWLQKIIQLFTVWNETLFIDSQCPPCPEARVLFKFNFIEVHLEFNTQLVVHLCCVISCIEWPMGYVMLYANWGDASNN